MKKIVILGLATLIAASVMAEMRTFTLWGSNQVTAEPMYILIENGTKVLMCRTETQPERGLSFAGLSEDDLAYVETLNLEVRQK